MAEEEYPHVHTSSNVEIDVFKPQLIPTNLGDIIAPYRGPDTKRVNILDGYVLLRFKPQLPGQMIRKGDLSTAAFCSQGGRA